MRSDKIELSSGEIVSYDTIHYRMRRTFGKPSQCEFDQSHESGRFHWAHKHEAPWDVERENWIRLCSRCHIRYDKGHKAVIKANSERVWTKEMRQRMSEAKSGDKNGFFGKTHSPETKKILKAKALDRVRPALPKTTCECGLTTTPGPLSYHQKQTGHKTP